MELPKAAVWMVGVGLLGGVGTGVAYYVQEMSQRPGASTPFDDLTEPPQVVDKSRQQAASDDSKTGPDTPSDQQAKTRAPPEPKACRALVNVRVGGTHDDVYDYRVFDVTFAPDGQVKVAHGPGAAVATPDGNYALQLGVVQPLGQPQQQLQTRAIYADGPAEIDLWSYPDMADGVAQNDGYILWPFHKNFARLRATIDRFVSVQMEVVNSEGGMREESGGVFSVESGASAQPLRLNMAEIRGRAAAFPHQNAATQEGSESLWEQFEDKGEGDFLLRLANGPGKSVQPEAGLCCYESEGASQIVFARLDRGAFALMAPGYLSRPDGFVRGGDGCGEFGWDGESVYARRRNADTWMPVGFDAAGTKVREFLGVYWLPSDSDFDIAQQPPKPEWPTPQQLAERIEPLMTAANAALNQGNGRKAAANFRTALRLKLLLGQEVTEEERITYNKAVALTGHPKKARSYFDYRMRVSDSGEEKRRIERMKQPGSLANEFEGLNR